jgi:hypothetical protein
VLTVTHSSVPKQTRACGDAAVTVSSSRCAVREAYELTQPELEQRLNRRKVAAAAAASTVRGSAGTLSATLRRTRTFGLRACAHRAIGPAESAQRHAEDPCEG